MNNFCKDLYHALTRKKTLPTSVKETTLVRCLSTIDLTLVGVGSTLGSGIYVLTGDVARNKSGPAIVIAFFIAAVASVLSGLCYAEFAARVPKAGSAYVYCYLVVGELPAFVIGWNLLLEYIIGGSAIGRAVSTYIDTLSDGYIQNKTISLIGKIGVHGLSSYFDIFSFLLIMLISVVLSFGIKNSSRFNNICVVINLLTITTVTVVGAFYSEPKNWNNFTPFGVKGIIAGSASCFYAFIGFDVIATTSEEARNPARSIPISMIGTITICFIAYFGVSTVVTMMVPYTELNVNAAVADVFKQRNVKVMGTLIAVGATAGLIGCAVVSLLPSPRLLYALAQDGMLFRVFSRVSKKTGVPVIGTLSCGLFIALVAALLDLDELVEMLSIGTLMAYSIVAICVLILRYRPSESNVIRKVKPRDQTLKNEDVGCNDGAKTSEEETSIIRNSQQTCFDSGCTPSNKTLLINTIIMFIVLELAIVSFLLGKSYSRFDRKYKTIIADIEVIVILLLVIGKGIFLSMQDSSESTKSLDFKAPFVPWLPIVVLFANISLMFQLSPLTWYRFVVWLAIGLIFYFAYGIRHSKERIGNKDVEVSATDDRSPLISPVDGD